MKKNIRFSSRMLTGCLTGICLMGLLHTGWAAEVAEEPALKEPEVAESPRIPEAPRRDSVTGIGPSGIYSYRDPEDGSRVTGVFNPPPASTGEGSPQQVIIVPEVPVPWYPGGGYPPAGRPPYPRPPWHPGPPSGGWHPRPPFPPGLPPSGIQPPVYPGRPPHAGQYPGLRPPGSHPWGVPAPGRPTPRPPHFFRPGAPS